MTNLFHELINWAESANEVIFDDELKRRLGEYAPAGQENSRSIRAYTFKYKSNDSLISGFLIAPKHNGQKPLPVVIFNRGGNRDYGYVKKGSLFTRLAWLANAGFLVIGSQYPGNSTSEGKDEWGGRDIQSVLDLHSLIEQLTAADQSRIGMLGLSRGGMMTYLALTKANWIKAAVTVAGVANLERLVKNRPEMQTVFIDSFGGAPEELERRSAVLWPDKISNTPLLLLHGTADSKVSYEDSVELGSKLTGLRKPHRLILFEGAGHGLTEVEDEWHHETIHWFEQL